MSNRDDPSIEAPPPHFTLSRSARTGRGRGRGVFTVAVLAACGAALVIARWPHAFAPTTRATPTRATASRGPIVVARNAASPVPARPQALPCYANGLLIGEFTAEACASRYGVTSGPPAASGNKPEAPATATLPAMPPPAPPAADVEVAQAGPAPPGPALASPAPAPASQAALKPPPKASRPRAIRYAMAKRPPTPEIPVRTPAAGAVREFYAALGQGDGAKAAAVVAPEAREDGPLSAGALTQYYSSLRVPIRVTKIDPIDGDKVFVRYQFVTRDDHLCLGSATVDTTQRDGGTLIRAIRTFDGC
jgi:hypothetical protein